MVEYVSARVVHFILHAGALHYISSDTSNTKSLRYEHNRLHTEGETLASNKG
jgi:hypothetical protein